MKTHISLRVAAATALILTLAGCKDTWLMYDTSQKDHLYFEVTSALPQVSFSLIEDQQIEYNVAVKMMGMPVDYDRTFSIEYIGADPDETITVGTEKIPVITARSGTDFEIGAIDPARRCSRDIDSPDAPPAGGHEDQICLYPVPDRRGRRVPAAGSRFHRREEDQNPAVQPVCQRR